MTIGALWTDNGRPRKTMIANQARVNNSRKGQLNPLDMDICAVKVSFRDNSRT
jgi:hypothetical protein